jgi:hypothetical protein
MTAANQAILALLALAAMSALQVWLALRRGWFRNRLGGVYRATRPLLFRLMLILCCVICAASLGLALWLATHA